MITITIEEKAYAYEAGISLRRIAEQIYGESHGDYILALVDGKLQELFKGVYRDAKISFVHRNSVNGRRCYMRGLSLLMLAAFYKVYGMEACNSLRIEYSLGDGIYCEGKDGAVTEAYLEPVKQEMRRLVACDYAIEKKSMNTANAIRMFREAGMHDKERLLRFRRVSKTNVYSLNGYTDYFYGYMPPSTGVLSVFDLQPYKNGFVLLQPDSKCPEQAAKPKDLPKLYNTLQEATKQGGHIDICTVGDLNECISRGGIEDIILIQEALQEKKLAEIAEKIKQTGNKKFIMIAGPSSSGKTTFSHRLSIQLRIMGYRPHPIALDDYYIDRELTPKDENGEYDFECLEAINIELFNRQMLQLLAGEEVELPQFNFKTGKSEFRGKKLQLGKDDILVIEGIHGLNDALSYSLPKESKFKIYISALTELNVDAHNRIPTTDGRLLRRMVRDARTRNTTARETIAMWPSVRRGEERNIFPFQEEVDVMYNSALVYELAVLKQYAEPLLFGIPEDCPEYVEAHRLLKFLDYFLGIPTESIPKNAILREFIGGSCFHA